MSYRTDDGKFKFPSQNVTNVYILEYNSLTLYTERYNII